ncbi:uncharacterized protein SCHCODRAFT_02623010 [Schizophyllum commune H4-8]|uniref:Expressed protein n=1 Tax=Schizophyllum commune (strain H4-8 / FGSC 9210) TaxID=578458 RepID=D8PRN9_SCHCM|nr:uncharacterized protein SCHCODRAFT_02623010 [Schizophyllum commune H4-8]KAI5893873.1 hypothetical protein SCHCODRAFT_02623010 [Schizophyllum commune H4-8]
MSAVNDDWQAQLHAAYASSPATGSSETDNASAIKAESFDELLSLTPMPPPGPDYFAARRALWNSDWKKAESKRRTPPPPPSSARQRLEQQTASPDVIYNDQVWAAHLQKIWKSLAAGDRFKYPMPLRIVVRIAQAAWLRDNIWPPGMVVASTSDAELEAPAFTFAEGQSSSASAVGQVMEARDESMVN